MHLLGHARAEDDRRGFPVAIHEADVRRPFPAADQGFFAGDFSKIPAERLDDGAVRGNRRRLGEITGEDNFGGVVFQPGIVGDLLPNEFDELRTGNFVLICLLVLCPEKVLL